MLLGLEVVVPLGTITSLFFSDARCEISVKYNRPPIVLLLGCPHRLE